MRLRAGASGFSYKEWKGPFYPDKLPNKDMLSYYAERLSTFEINNTFYRMPKRDVLFQLPPNLKKDIDRLQAFIAALPPELRAAFEFRNESWFDDEVYESLRDGGHALCLADTDDTDDLNLVSTCDRGYLPLRREDYGDDAVRAWLASIQAQPWKEAFVFFKHEDEGAAPRLAARLLQLHSGSGSG